MTGASVVGALTEALTMLCLSLFFALCAEGGLCGPGLNKSSSEEEKDGRFALVRVGFFRACSDGRGEEEERGRRGDGGGGC